VNAVVVVKSLACHPPEPVELCKPTVYVILPELGSVIAINVTGDAPLPDAVAPCTLTEFKGLPEPKVPDHKVTIVFAPLPLVYTSGIKTVILTFVMPLGVVTVVAKAVCCTAVALEVEPELLVTGVYPRYCHTGLPLSDITGLAFLTIVGVTIVGEVSTTNLEPVPV
jgi:hypothetical protein